MRFPMRARRSLPASLAIVVLTGCSGGGVSQLGPSGLVQLDAARTDVMGPHLGHTRSWMEPNAKNARLLYVSSMGGNEINVYGYPSGKEAGLLTGPFVGPAGECVDSAGDVWIANDSSVILGFSSQGGSDPTIVEYAHGGTSPIATLDDPGQYPAGCSVNPKTGDLAVTNYETTSDGQGSVAVYKKANGNPTLYSDPNLEHASMLGYDNKGNLFVDGTNNAGAFLYTELPKGGSAFTDITLVGATIKYPGGVQWDGHHMAVGDQVGVIYQTSGATVLGSTTLTGACQIFMFFVDKHRVVGPDRCGPDADIYKYPAGGPPINIINGGVVGPVGAVVSE